jgi:hypothetical protein
VLGCVNSAHKYDRDFQHGKIAHFMNAYLHPEWEDGKGSNVIVASLWETAIRFVEQANCICQQLWQSKLEQHCIKNGSSLG